MRLAIFQNGDTPQIESTADMLREAGYETRICGPALRKELGRAGCDTVLGVDTMYALGYDRLDPSIRMASVEDMGRCDLFVEIKVRNVPRIAARWPRLKGRILYWRVNGAQPEICERGGDEVNLPCPIATACLWYGLERYRHGRDVEAGQHPGNHEKDQRRVHIEELKLWASQVKLHDTESNSYVFWPHYPREAEYAMERRTHGYSLPYCMCHSVRAWGYGSIVDRVMTETGCKFYGNNSPAGQVPHHQVPDIARTALSLVHLKSVDCPGWALYEALLSGCPVVTGRLLNSRMLAYGLLEHDITCYEFGLPASLEYGRGDVGYDECVENIKYALFRLAEPTENRRIGEAGRERLKSLMWKPDGTFPEFIQRHFG